MEQVKGIGYDPWLSNHMLPHKLRFLYRIFRANPCTILDVGCGNHSARITKRWLPQCRYYGLDFVDYNNAADDFKVMDHFYKLDLTKDDLSSIPDEFFDAVILSHVIEHLHNGLDVLKRLSRKVKPGGNLYVEFPSLNHLNLPPGKHAPLNFCDDPTHVRVYSIQEVANAMLNLDFRIYRAGRARDQRIWLTPAILLYKVYEWIRFGSISARGLTEMLGLADYVFAVRKTSLDSPGPNACRPQTRSVPEASQ